MPLIVSFDLVYVINFVFNDNHYQKCFQAPCYEKISQGRMDIFESRHEMKKRGKLLGCFGLLKFTVRIITRIRTKLRQNRYSGKGFRIFQRILENTEMKKSLVKRRHSCFYAFLCVCCRRKKTSVSPILPLLVFWGKFFL